MEDQPSSVAKEFSRGVFTYLQYKEGCPTLIDVGLAAHPMPVLIPAVARVVSVFSELSASFREECKACFREHDINRSNVTNFIYAHCSNYVAEHDDIFYVILKTCTFMHCLVLFCYDMDYLEIISRAPDWWSTIFVHLLAEKFYADGGWEEFEKYVRNNGFFSNLKLFKYRTFCSLFAEANSFFSTVGIIGHRGGNEQSEMQQQNQMPMETSDEETDTNSSDNMEQETDSSSETEDSFMEELNRLGFSFNHTKTNFSSDERLEVFELKKKIIRKTVKTIMNIFGSKKISHSQESLQDDSNLESYFSTETEEIKLIDRDSSCVGELIRINRLHKKIIVKFLNILRKNYNLPLTEYGNLD